MAALILLLFPLLLLYRPRAAMVALVVGIVLLYRQRSSGARQAVRRPVSDEI